MLLAINVAQMIQLLKAQINAATTHPTTSILIPLALADPKTFNL